MNDSRAAMSVETVFEVKTYSASKTTYSTGSRQAVSPTSMRAAQIAREYKAKMTNIDIMFAPEVVGDGTENVVGPFETVFGEFHRGWIISLVAGWFGEMGIFLNKPH